MNSHRIRAIFADEDFSAFMSKHMEKLTKKVMSRATTPEDRAQALAEFHALERFLGGMRSEAQNAEKDSE